VWWVENNARSEKSQTAVIPRRHEELESASRMRKRGAEVVASGKSRETPGRIIPAGKAGDLAVKPQT